MADNFGLKIGLEGEKEFMNVPPELKSDALEQISKFEAKIEEEKAREEEERQKRVEAAAERRMKAMLDIEEEVPQKAPGEDTFARRRK